MSGMLFLMFVQSLFQFGAKEGNQRAITGRKIILTCPLKKKSLSDQNIGTSFFVGTFSFFPVRSDSA